MASHPNEDNSFARMQHLIDEMSVSNYRIDQFSKKYDNEDAEVSKDTSVSHKKPSSMDRQYEVLYDDAWRSEESDGASLPEVPIHNYANDTEDSGCEEVVNSAIAEVSNDFLSGLRQSAAQNICIDSDESRLSSDNDGKLLTGLASYARYPETGTGLSDTDWNPYGTESDTNQSPRLQPLDNANVSKCSLLTSFTPLLNSTDINTVTPSSLARISPLIEERMSDIEEKTEKDSTLIHCLIPDNTTYLSTSESTLNPSVVKKKSDKSSGDEEKESSNEEKQFIASTSSTGYSSATSGAKMDSSKIASISKPLSVIERAKLMGIPEDILLDKSGKNLSSKTRNLHHKYGQEDGNESDDLLGKKVRALLSGTSHLSSYDKSSSVDYTVLQRDLQEIQDNLDSFGVSLPETRSESRGTGKSKSQTSSDGEGEIIPSTTTTPEKSKRKMIWDYARGINTLSNRQDPGLMEEISQRPVSDKHLYNSDGDETRTSESSTKAEDHAAADLALAEMSEILHPSVRDLNSSTDVDRMVSSFQDKRRQLESRYQQLNNQGLAEKVFRILTNQDPELQANGILSEVSADEKEMRTRLALSIQDKNFNYSSTSIGLEEMNQSFNPQDEVRKKLDMSELSSIDSSLMLDKSAAKGFSALDDARRLLSSQMMKASERTFNHSIEMRVPQTIQCYPLFVGSTTDESGKRAEPWQNDETQKKEEIADQGTAEASLQGTNGINRDGSSVHQQEHTGETMRDNTSPTSSDQGISTTSIRPKDKYRPYRPPGSKEVYYAESDTASVADSVTTIESTHIGSDDAKGPSLPSHALGSRKDPPKAGGIYSHLNLSTVCEDTELATIDEKNENNSQSSRGQARDETTGSPGIGSTDMTRREAQKPRESLVSYPTQRYIPTFKVRRDEQNNDVLERKRYEREAGDGLQGNPASQVERESDRSPTNGISAARREARWAHRTDEMNKEEQPPRYESLRPHLRNGSNRTDYDKQDSPRREHDEVRPRRLYSSLDDVNKIERTDGKEDEPLSLRIQMTYTDENKLREHGRNRIRDRDFERNENRLKEFLSYERDDVEQERLPQREGYRFDRHHHSDDVRNRFSPTDMSSHLSHRQVLIDESLDDNLNSVGVRMSPAFRHALSPDGENGLLRTGSDENLSSRIRDARLSPAFRRALSPDLRSAIERRSPLLSRHLERSLAQPPADCPVERKVNAGDSYEDRSQRPVFLARDRPLSPRDYGRSRPCDRRRSPVGSGELNPRPRPRSVSPFYGERDGLRNRSPSGRNNDNMKAEIRQGQRVFITQDNSKSSPKPKRKVELTLERMSSESEADLEMDQEPLSKRAQILKSALSDEREPLENQDLNAMWEKFKAMNDSTSSSINSTKIESVANLLKSPSRHLITEYVKEREEYRIERQERAEMERERRLKEQQMHKHSSSEDEINERYAELLAMKEEERLKRRAAKKKKGKPSPAVAGVERKTDKDNLFSIPEDRGQEPSPVISMTPSKHQKSKVTRQTHVIDPNMLKLRDKITKQKTKVDKEMLKEMRRIDKLKTLERLLVEKKRGKISNETLQNQLEELSSTSAVVSDLSNEITKDNHQTQGFFDDSTTAKDSSAEMHALKVEKERRQKEFKLQHQVRGDSKSVKDKNNHRFKIDPISPDISEIRLLKLVKDGYLTPDEAYKLARDRASSNGNDSLNSSRDSSINSDNGHSGKFHKLYSPYSRSSNHSTQMRHMPKLKFSGTFPHSSYGLDDYERERTTFPQKPRKSESSVHQRRPKSHSPSRGINLGPTRGRHSSPSTSRRQFSASPSGKQYRNQSQHFSRKPKKSENDSGSKIGEACKGSVAWHIPVNLPASQWKEPQPKQHLQEVTSSVSNRSRKERKEDLIQREAAEVVKESKRDETVDSIWSKSSHPRGIPKLEWEEVVKCDALASKTNHWEVDPMMDRVQYILNKPDSHCGDQSERSGCSDSCEKPPSKASLQDAFQFRKQSFISKCSERQKRILLAKEERQLQECLRLEREAIFAEHERLAPPNLYAHPYSDNLYQPKHRILTKQEMRSLTAKRYNKLPEVVEKKEETKKQMEVKLNRLRANLFNKKVQRDVLRKTWKQRA